MFLIAASIWFSPYKLFRKDENTYFNTNQLLIKTMHFLLLAFLCCLLSDHNFLAFFFISCSLGTKPFSLYYIWFVGSKKWQQNLVEENELIISSCELFTNSLTGPFSAISSPCLWNSDTEKLKNRSPYVLCYLHKYNSDNLELILMETFIIY